MIGKATRQKTKPDQDMPQSQHALVGGAQGRGALAVDFQGMVQLLQGFFSYGTVVAETFDFEKTSVGLKADLPESREVTQSFAEVEVTGIVDGGFGAGPDLGDAGNLLKVLLDARAFVVDVQRGDHPLGQHAGAEAAWGARVDPPVEDQLHLVGTAQVEVFANDFLEEDSAAQRAIQDLSQGKLGLENGQVVAVASGAILRGKGMGQAGQPAAQELIDLLGSELFTDGLLGISTGSEAVVQRLIGYSLLLELTLGVLVTIHTQLGGIGKIGAELQEKGAEVSIHTVPVVLVDHGCGTNDPGIALAGLRVASLFGAEDGSLFLVSAQKHYPFLLIEVAELFRHHLFLALSFIKLDQRDLVLGKVFDGGYEALGHGTHEGRGRNGLSPMAVKKTSPLHLRIARRAHRDSGTSGQWIPIGR